MAIATCAGVGLLVTERCGTAWQLADPVIAEDSGERMQEMRGWFALWCTASYSLLREANPFATDEVVRVGEHARLHRRFCSQGLSRAGRSIMVHARKHMRNMHGQYMSA